jgi:hypothetical protein
MGLLPPSETCCKRGRATCYFLSRKLTRGRKLLQPFLQFVTTKSCSINGSPTRTGCVRFERSIALLFFQVRSFSPIETIRESFFCRSHAHQPSKCLSSSGLPTRYPAPSARNIYLFLSSSLSLLPSKDELAAVSFSLPTSPHNPTRSLASWCYCDLAPPENATLDYYSSSLVVRPSLTFFASTAVEIAQTLSHLTKQRLT